MSDAFLWLALIGGGFTLIAALAQVGQGVQAVTLPHKFAKLGTLTDMTKTQIIEAVGPPNSISAVSANTTLLQWQAPGYHVALSFTGEICNGVTHESSHLG